MSQQIRGIRRRAMWTAVGSLVTGGGLFGGAASAPEVLPAPPVPFKGQAGLRVKDSRSDFPQPIQAPKGAPNKDTGTPVNLTYDVSCRFSGRLGKVVIRLGEAAMSFEDPLNILREQHQEKQPSDEVPGIKRLLSRRFVTKPGTRRICDKVL